jgi:hypothetical protein
MSLKKFTRIADLLQPLLTSNDTNVAGAPAFTGVAQLRRATRFFEAG